MYRAAKEKLRTRNEWRKHWNNHVSEHVRAGGQRDIWCPCDTEVNRFRKGQPAFGHQRQCLMCHFEKKMGFPTRKELVHKMKEKEGLKEVE